MHLKEYIYFNFIYSSKIAEKKFLYVTFKNKMICLSDDN